MTVFHGIRLSFGLIVFTNNLYFDCKEICYIISIAMTYES